MTKISAVIITYNEEGNIARCLQSLQAVVDEVVVLDSGSTDDTIAICESFGAHVYHHPFDGYAEQKNRANSFASHSFILSVDADEVLSSELTESIVKAKNHWKGDGYRMNRLTMFCGKFMHHGGWYPDDNIRLFDKSKGEWRGAKVHESFQLHSGSQGDLLAGDLLHYSYHAIDQYVATITKYSRLKAEVLYEAGKKSSLLALVFSPIWKFFMTYVLKMGFRDGLRGFIVSVGAAHGVFVKYAVLFQLTRFSKRTT